VNPITLMLGAAAALLVAAAVTAPFAIFHMIWVGWPFVLAGAALAIFGFLVWVLAKAAEGV